LVRFTSDLILELLESCYLECCKVLQSLQV
jgi:hypothetical protein